VSRNGGRRDEHRRRLRQAGRDRARPFRRSRRPGRVQGRARLPVHARHRLAGDALLYAHLAPRRGQARERHPNGYRQQHYTVGIQAFIEKTTAGSASWSRVATAFHHAFLDALAANVKLEDGDVQLNSLRSGTEAGTLTRLEWNEIAYVGLDYEVDVIIDGVTLVGP
jgi:hypothetical protein